MRTNLKVFRIKRNLKQSEMAEKIGVSRMTYSHVENGKREGTLTFWNSLQSAFNVPDNEMWELQKLER